LIQVGQGLLDHRPFKDGRDDLDSPGPSLFWQPCINQFGAASCR
jgi:hypothetical protein